MKKRIVRVRPRSRGAGVTARQRLEQRRLLDALEAGFGAWKDEDHPEINGPEGTEGWVRQLRDLDARRFEEMLREH